MNSYLRSIGATHVLHTKNYWHTSTELDFHSRLLLKILKRWCTSYKNHQNSRIEDQKIQSLIWNVWIKFVFIYYYFLLFLYMISNHYQEVPPFINFNWRSENKCSIKIAQSMFGVFFLKGTKRSLKTVFHFLIKWPTQLTLPTHKII